MLNKEFDYFLKNQKELAKKYRGKFLVIKDEEVIGVYDSELEAYEKTKAVEKLGTFLIQQSLPGKEGYTQSFHSRVSV